MREAQTVDRLTDRPMGRMETVGKSCYMDRSKE